MAGLAQVFLTDHELDTILAWAHDATLDLDDPRDALLRSKLLGIRRTLECGCKGASCKVIAPGAGEGMSQRNETALKLGDGLHARLDEMFEDAAKARRDHPHVVSWQEFWRGRQGALTDIRVWLEEQGVKQP